MRPPPQRLRSSRVIGNSSEGCVKKGDLYTSLTHHTETSLNTNKGVIPKALSGRPNFGLRFVSNSAIGFALLRVKMPGNRRCNVNFKSMGLVLAFCWPLGWSQDSPNYSVQPKQLADLVAGGTASVIFVQTEAASGTGFYVWVLTARHVVKLQNGETAKDIKLIQFLPAGMVGKSIFKDESSEFTASVLAEDPEHDLVLLNPKVNPLTHPMLSVNGRTYPPSGVASICKRTDPMLRSGDPIFTVGFPLGDPRPITTAGIVASSQAAAFDLSGTLQGTYLVDMVINPGNSGGPVFSSAIGCVIGVADAIRLSPIVGAGGAVLPRVDLTVTGPDGRPAMKDGKPLTTTLSYNSGLGILIPQKYVLQLLDRAGGHNLTPNSPNAP